MSEKLYKYKTVKNNPRKRYVTFRRGCALNVLFCKCVPRVIINRSACTLECIENPEQDSQFCLDRGARRQTTINSDRLLLRRDENRTILEIIHFFFSCAVNNGNVFLNSSRYRALLFSLRINEAIE